MDWLTPRLDSIPPDLTAVNRWVCWDKDKKPLNPRTGRNASVTNAKTWADFKTASNRFSGGLGCGVGIVLTGDGLAGIDIDKVQDTEAAISIIKRAGCTYCEISPSGKGIRGFGYADNLESGRRGVVNGLNVELYTSGRYLTVTGHTLDLFSGELVRMNGFAELADEIGQGARADITSVSSVSSVSQYLPYLSISVGDEESFHPDCRPAAEGQRHRKLFQLARWVKAHEPDANDRRLAEIARAWFNTFQDRIGTKDVDLTVAQSIESGKPVDDADLLSIGLKRQVLSKRQQLTQQAHQKALDAVKADRQSIDQHQAEVNRLKALIRSNQIRGALREVIDKLVKDGHPKSIVIEHVKAFI